MVSTCFGDRFVEKRRRLGHLLYKPPSEEQTTYDVLNWNDDKLCTLKPLAFFVLAFILFVFSRERMSLIWGRGLLEGLSRLQPSNRGFHLSATCCKISAGRYKVGFVFLKCCGSALISVRIWIQLFTSVRTRIQGDKPMRIRILVRFCRH